MEINFAKFYLEGFIPILAVFNLSFTEFNDEIQYNEKPKFQHENVTESPITRIK